MKLGIDTRYYTVPAVKQINTYLGKKNTLQTQPGEYRTNLWGNTCICLDQEYIVPGSHLFLGIDERELFPYIADLYRLVPQCLYKTQLIPQSFVTMDHMSLYFVRPHNIEDRMYLYVFEVLINYMGGAESGEIIKDYAINHGPSFRTGRIYYLCHLIPVDKLNKSSRLITGYQPTDMKPIIRKFHVPVVSTGPHDWSGSIMFDSPDFSMIHQRLSSLAWNKEWKNGNRFWPVKYKYESIALHLPVPDITIIESVLPDYDDYIQAINRKESIQFKYQNTGMQAYLDKWQTEAVFSRGLQKEHRLTFSNPVKIT